MTQQNEIATIKSRTFHLELSEADVQKLIRKAGEQNLTAKGLLESFIGDLVDGTYITDDHAVEIANRWAEYRKFDYRYEKSLISFLCSGEWWGNDIEDFTKLMEEISNLKKYIVKTLDALVHPEDFFEDTYYVYDANSNAYIRCECTMEEHLADLQQELENYQEDLVNAEEELEDLKECFSRYMGKQEYSWETEYEKFKKWYEACQLEQEEEVPKEQSLAEQEEITQEQLTEQAEAASEKSLVTGLKKCRNR